MTERPDPDDIVRRISAFGLPDGDGIMSPVAIEDEDWKLILLRLESRRITGFAVAAAEAGRLELSFEQTDGLLEAHRKAMLVPLAVERSLLELEMELEDRGVEFVVLKGSALAHTVYPDPSWRFFGDLDLLVRTEAWRSACALLENLGYRRKLPEPRAGFDERFGSAATFRRENGGIEVDLHRNLVLGPFGLWVDSRALFDGVTDLSLWGRTFKRLDDSLLQLHACIHCVLGGLPPLTVPVRDVAQVAHYGKVDWEALADQATRWKLRAVVRHAMQTASDVLGVSLPPGAESMEALTPTRKERRALGSYVTSRRHKGGIARSTLSAIPGVRAKAAYVRALVFPDRRFLAARSGSQRPSYRHRWAVPLRWVLRRRRNR